MMTVTGNLIAWLRITLLMPTLAAGLAGCVTVAEEPPESAYWDLPLEQKPTPPLDPLYTLKWDGYERSYRVHKPLRMVAGGKLPLVLVLHSAVGSGALIAERSDMNLLADEQGFIAVYPNGSGPFGGRMFTWNGGHCCGYAVENRIDDVGFIGALLDSLIEQYPVDPRRVYVVGFSNGGMLAYRLAAAMSERIAAVAVISGTLGGTRYRGDDVQLPPTPNGPVSMLIIHGREDRQIAYDGGRGERTYGFRTDLSVQTAMEFWTRNNRCDTEPVVDMPVPGIVTRSRHACSGTNTEVVLYTLERGGHAWPGGENVRGVSLEKFVVRMVMDNPVQELVASDVVWDFFRGHARSAVDSTTGRHLSGARSR